MPYTATPNSLNVELARVPGTVDHMAAVMLVTVAVPAAVIIRLPVTGEVTNDPVVISSAEAE